jgi:hypothetical protein
MSLGRMGDDGKWTWPWGQEKPPSPQQNRTSQQARAISFGSNTKAEHHAVASAVFTEDLELQSTRQRSKAKDIGLGLIKIRRPTERPPPTEWVNLNQPAKGLRRQNSMGVSIAQPIADDSMSWEGVVKVEAQRQRLLTLARSAAPIDTVFRLSLLPRTVIPRLWKYKSLWVVLIVYIVSATVTRLGYHIDGPQAQETLEQGSSFVAFIIVFFVGYCYKRHEEQFDDVQHIMNSIASVCLMARANFEDQGEVYRIWRYVNAMHCTAYCGLTDHLTEANFFIPLSTKHGLLGSKKIQQVESAAVRDVGIDANGVRACSMFEVWAMEVIREESTRCKTPAPIQAMLQSEVSEIGLHIKKLFAYRYQVLPFIYTHLVSALSTFYLIVTAFLKGLYFEPDEPALMGLGLPLIGLFVAILSTYGLLEVGNTILDPFGDEPEDFALTHFVEHAVGVSREAIEIASCSKRGAHADFYSPEEIKAAFVVLKTLIRRFRWRQIIAAARKAREVADASFIRRQRPALSGDEDPLAGYGNALDHALVA